MYDIELNKIYHEDNLRTLGRMPDEFIDFVITSPPYDNLRAYDGYSFDFPTLAQELYRVLKKGGVIVWVVGDATINGSETGTSFRQALYFKDIGFNLHDTMIYQKTGCPFPETTRYYPNFEYMFVLSKGRPKTVHLIADRKNTRAGQKIARMRAERQVNGVLKENSAYRNDKNRVIKPYGVRYNIWVYSSGRNKTTLDIMAYEHPAMFPEQLVEDHIRSWTNEYDVVYDPFNGAGTTTKIAKKLNRYYIGSEVSERYCQIAEQRLLLVQNTEKEINE